MGDQIVSDSCVFARINKTIATILIISITSNAIGQIILDKETSDTVSVSDKTVGSDAATSFTTEAISDRTEEVKQEKLQNTDSYRGMNTSAQNRGVSSSEMGASSGNQRKLLPPPMMPAIPVDSLAVSDTVQGEKYKLGKTEKRILLITCASLVAGTLAIVLAKMITKSENQQEKESIPEPPPVPEF